MFWIFAITVTVAACAWLAYAARLRTVPATGADPGDAAPAADVEAATDRAHFRARLAEIDDAARQGLMAPTEAKEARAELARELVRHEAAGTRAAAARMPAFALPGVLGAVAVGAIGLYALIGNPGLPAQPLAGRDPAILAASQGITVPQMVQMIEGRLAETPEDAEGWAALGPIYMRLERYGDAAGAFRRVLALREPTADMRTNLAEALMMASEGSAQGEAMELLVEAAEAEPAHVRSRFYIAGEYTRIGDYVRAAAAWRELIGLARGDEPWLGVAHEGLDFAEARSGGAGAQVAEAEADSDMGVTGEMIADMVEGLDARLDAEGGTMQDWTMLVRARLVLDQSDEARQAYERAVAAYPDPADRTELDALAEEAGLTME